MKNTIATVVLLIAALTLIAVTVWRLGSPLGYRGRQGVVKQVIGGVELRRDASRPQTAHALSWIESGTEIRTASYATAVIETPRGRIELLDSSTLVGPRLTPDRPSIWRLVSGRTQITVDHAQGLAFGPSGSSTYVELFPGRYTLSADGRGLLVGYCTKGTMMLHEGESRPTEISQGQFFLASPMTPAVVVKAPPPLTLSARVMARSRTGELATINGNVTPGGRIFINGEITYPGTSGEFEAALSPGTRRAVVVAEDVSGKAERRVLTVPR